MIASVSNCRWMNNLNLGICFEDWYPGILILGNLVSKTASAQQFSKSGKFIFYDQQITITVNLNNWTWQTLWIECDQKIYYFYDNDNSKVGVDKIELLYIFRVCVWVPKPECRKIKNHSTEILFRRAKNESTEKT